MSSTASDPEKFNDSFLSIILALRQHRFSLRFSQYPDRPFGHSYHSLYGHYRLNIFRIHLQFGKINKRSCNLLLLFYSALSRCALFVLRLSFHSLYLLSFKACSTWERHLYPCLCHSFHLTCSLLYFQSWPSSLLSSCP